MSKTAFPVARPWADRWNEPPVETLLHEVKETHRNVLPTLRQALHAMPGMEERVVWLGDAWKWAIEYCLPPHHQSGADHTDKFAILVPDPETPVLVLPIQNAFIDALPFKRLNRYVRDGIKSGKLAVNIIWIQWSPGPGPELEHLVDILKRKNRFLTAPPEPKGAAEPAAKEEAAKEAPKAAAKPKPAPAKSAPAKK